MALQRLTDTISNGIRDHRGWASFLLELTLLR